MKFQLAHFMIPAGLVGVGLIAYSIRTLLDGGKAKIPEMRNGQQKETKTLAELSDIWKERVLDFKEISRIWREPDNTDAVLEELVPVFQKKDVDDFFTEFVLNRQVVKGERKQVIIKILQILDTEGDCPSVVRKTEKEPEFKLDNDVFGRLASVPLYKHCLDVSKRFATNIRYEAMLPDALIISLGHDLGKIPSYLNAYYKTGDHPLVSIIVLNKIPEYAALSNREELDDVIRQHHYLQTKNSLAGSLRDADQQSRLAAISEVMTETPVADKKPTDILEFFDPGPPRNVDNTHVDGPIAPQAPVLPGEGTEERRRWKPEEVEIPDWFSADRVIEELGKMVNQVVGGRWQVVSAPDGLVYAQQDALWSVLKAMSNRDPILLAADADESMKRNILYSVVRKLSKQRNDVIATDYVAEGYYLTMAVVVSGSGKASHVPLIPFKAGLFGMPSVLEKHKLPLLKKQVANIKPKQVTEEGNQCAAY